MNLQELVGALSGAGLLWAALIIGAVMILHEFAHYWAARAQGVQVTAFSIGWGPVLLRRTWRGTDWRVSLLPIGAYVQIDGMAPDPGEDEPPQRGYTLLPAWGKIAILLAGPLANLLLALLLLTAVNTGQGLTDVRTDRAVVGQVIAGSAAERAGVRTGDVIVRLDGQPLPNSYRVDNEDRPGYLKVRDTLSSDGRHTLTVRRGAAERTIAFQWVAFRDGARQTFGIRYGPQQTTRAVTLPQAFTEAGRTVISAVPAVLDAFARLFRSFFTLDLATDGGVVGPVGTVQVVGEAARLGPWVLVGIAAAINLSVGFFNLLPIPGLDGGRILLILVGVLRGRPLSARQEGGITLAGFAFVMLLTVFVVLRDLTRFF
ncbi:M50 family metallopeptidase [Deinococcus maricopensis]|uniref:Peptidase M50 n=1 Tax=Deinococcus maricopensis (strain DSM 21211 / LMG 22137 / NRRL B-23946 / LB-34) TaxID=709986 RepID=E8UB37_DEIML|nr:M50 family metallopeptidase [Deinococcus maricopensis]ADV68276.1 peptidase M50 [Deinococcus maricopensis DSM 21211]